MTLSSVTELAGTVVSTAGVGSVAWSDPSNATADDGSNASCSLDPAEVTNYLRADNFGFAIPTGATITGIEVEVEGFNDISFNELLDNIARLVKAGTIVGDNNALGAWPTSATVMPYGGDDDLWGITWTPADVNHADFGFAISASDSGAGATNPRVDFIRITVHYLGEEEASPPSANLEVTPASGFTPLEVTADASGSFDPDDDIATYEFDWGDGSPNTGPQSGATAEHTYSDPDDYTVTVTVTDDEDLQDDAIFDVSVMDPVRYKVAVRAVDADGAGPLSSEVEVIPVTIGGEQSITPGSIVADLLAAGAITAEKLDVDELSAISANLGTVIAGHLTAVLIEAGVFTSDGMHMDDTRVTTLRPAPESGDLGHSVELTNQSGDHQLRFLNLLGQARSILDLDPFTDTLRIASQDDMTIHGAGDTTITGGGDIILGPSSGQVSISGLRIIIGPGSPGSVVSAPVGSIFLRTDDHTGGNLYVKQGGGTGNTGWVEK